MAIAAIGEPNPAAREIVNRNRNVPTNSVITFMQASAPGRCRTDAMLYGTELTLRKARSAKSDRLAARPRSIDRLNDPDVSQTFLAGRVELCAREDAIRERIHHRRELVVHGHLHGLAVDGEAVAIVIGGGVGIQGALLADNLVLVLARLPGVAAGAVGHEAAREGERKVDGVFDVDKPIVVHGIRDRCDD